MSLAGRPPVEARSAGQPQSPWPYRTQADTEPVRHTSILLAFTAVAAASVFAAGCARHPRPTLPAAELYCPPPMLWRSGEPRPRAIRVVNHGADSVVVFTDDCLGTTRVGDVGPKRTRLFALPKRLIVYEDGLRLHVVRGAGTANPDVVVTAIPVDTTRVLHLEVPEAQSSCPIDVYVDGEPFTGDTLPAIGDEIVKVDYYYPWARPPGMEGECPAINLVTRRQRKT